MKRRDFLAAGARATLAMACPALWLPGAARAQGTALVRPGVANGYANLLILVELKGGNDGLNTVVPFADPLYYSYRQTIGVPRAQAIQLDERTALHPTLAPLMPMWRAHELAIVQGVSYPQPNLSHFRSRSGTRLRAPISTCARAGSRGHSQAPRCRVALPPTRWCSAAQRWGRSPTARAPSRS